MKSCPTCSRAYSDDTLNFCLDDGSPLSNSSIEEMHTLPLLPMQPASLHQHIRYTETPDGVHIAYSVIGSGPLLVRVLGHFTHLEMEWEWPELRYFWEKLAERFTVIRYDGRGIGMSGKFDGDFTEETRRTDLEAVLDATEADSDIALLGISEGGWTSADFTVRHPERISRLVLYGSYCRGAQARPNFDSEEDEALNTLIRKAWGRSTPAFRQLFTSRFFGPDADRSLLAHFDDMQRRSADPETAARYYESLHKRGDGTELFGSVRVPTFVVHFRDDTAVSADEGRLLASVIPGAQLVLLPGGSHYFLTDRALATSVADAIGRFFEKQ